MSTRPASISLLPRARRLTALGVQGGKQLPATLPAFTVVGQEADLIEGEVAEDSAPRLLAE